MTFTRPLVSLAIAGLLGLPLLPPEHVHISESDDHRHSEFIHRHFEAHHPIEVAHATHATPEVDHQDEDAALWLDTLYLTAIKAPLPSIDRVVVQELPLLQPRPLPRWTLEFEHLSLHDPPWIAPSGLRAPPTYHV